MSRHTVSRWHLACILPTVSSMMLGTGRWAYRSGITLNHAAHHLTEPQLKEERLAEDRMVRAEGYVTPPMAPLSPAQLKLLG